MTMKPRTQEELDDHAKKLKEQAKSGQLRGAELQAKIDELNQWGTEFYKEAEELERYKVGKKKST